jgi:hypothetical protein
VVSAADLAEEESAQNTGRCFSSKVTTVSLQ